MSLQDEVDRAERSREHAYVWILEAEAAGNRYVAAWRRLRVALRHPGDPDDDPDPPIKNDIRNT